MIASLEKAHLRREMKAARSQLNELERARAALGLCQGLWPLLQAHRAAPVGVYLARPFELSLDPIIETLLEANVCVCAPRLDLELQTMKFFRLSYLDSVRNGPWNVREPVSDELITPEVVLIPGLAFDSKGHRLGTGGGWYDRTISPDMVAVGVGFDWQIVPHVPIEAHDRPMNRVFSPTRSFGPFQAGNGE